MAKKIRKNEIGKFLFFVHFQNINIKMHLQDLLEPFPYLTKDIVETCLEILSKKSKNMELALHEVIMREYPFTKVYTKLDELKGKNENYG